MSRFIATSGFKNNRGVSLVLTDSKTESNNVLVSYNRRIYSNLRFGIGSEGRIANFLINNPTTITTSSTDETTNTPSSDTTTNPYQTGSPFPYVGGLTSKNTLLSTYLGPSNGLTQTTLSLSGSNNTVPPIIDTNGNIYAFLNNNTLYSLTNINATVWSISLTFSSFTAPTITNTTLYINAGDGYLYALYITDGSLKWRLSLLDNNGGYITLGKTGILYFHDDSYLYSVTDNGSYGSINWNYNLGNYPIICAIDSNENIYVGTIVFNQYMYSFTSSGTLRWSYALDEDPTKPTIGTDGNIYFSTNVSSPIETGKVYSLSSSGLLNWVYDSGNFYILSNLALGSDNTVYFGRYDSDLIALTSDGVLKWSYTTPSVTVLSPVVDSHDVIYVSSTDNLMAVNDDGTLKWSATTSSGNYNSLPVIGKNNTLHIFTTTNELYIYS